MKVGVVINPGTPLVTIEPVLNLVDQVLLMTVNPGFGGQAYIPEVAEKIADLVKLREAKGLTFDIEVDGGIDDKTIHSAKNAGANVFVAGSYLFKGDLDANVAKLRAPSMIKIAVIAGGSFDCLPEPADLYVGVDAGSLRLLDHSLPLDWAIGDFDSVTPEELGAKGSSRAFLQAPAEKMIQTWSWL